MNGDVSAIDITVADCLRGGGALLMVLGATTVLGAVLLARDDGDHAGPSIAVFLPLLAIVVVAAALRGLV